MAPFPRALVLAAVGASLLAAGPTARAQAGGPSIRGYDVEIGVQRDGSILVVERIAYDFDGLARHGIFRDIPVRLPYSDRYDRVYVLDVLSDRAAGHSRRIQDRAPGLYPAHPDR